MSYEGVGSEAMDTEMKNVGGSSSEAKLTQPEGQTTVSLSLCHKELQLELGDKKMSASAVASETNHDHSASSKCEFV
ncbi:hypothetical protein HID58_009419 [Brassica napus]|uniref:Auxin-responsive protein n=1 Tax=Brassica napus TaxID=3708 RepID=A0ABQ8DTA2_BRANA|nr:hypothetical protein HID58_009419 [Brassica napus]